MTKSQQRLSKEIENIQNWIVTKSDGSTEKIPNDVIGLYVAKNTGKISRMELEK